MKTLIYLLEDDPDISRLISRTLGTQGMEVVCLRRLSEFEIALKQRTPDLCLIDLSLPDGDGMSLLGQSGKLHSLPKIVVSASNSISGWAMA